MRLPRVLAYALSLLLTTVACTSASPRSTESVQPSPQVTTPPPGLQAVRPLGMFCDVSRIRANFWGRPALDTAFVWRGLTPAGICPKQGGKTFVGFGLDDDGFVEQELGPYSCLTTCRAMRARDVNGDGLAELIVSDGMADGYAMRMFGVNFGRFRQDMAPVRVHGDGDWLVDPGILWIGASGSAGASRGAQCTTLPDGAPAIEIQAMTARWGIRRTVIVELDGVRARVVRAWNEPVGLRHHPASGLHCGESAVPARVEVPLCGTRGVTGNVDGDGITDRVSLGPVFGSDRGCGYGHPRRLDIDLADDGVRDISIVRPGCDEWCGLWGVADLNADGQLEIFINEQPLSPPDSALIGIYEVVGSDLRPIRFPSGSNRFSVRYSSFGYAGAYCTGPTTLLVWHAKDVDSDAGPSLSLNEATFRFDPSTLTMTPLTGWNRSRPDELPRDPKRPITICGSRMGSI